MRPAMGKLGIHSEKVSRRAWLGGVAAAGAALAVGSAAEERAAAAGTFRFCLNTATIRGQKLPIEKEVEVAAKAGYDAIEPWMDRLHDYVRRGNSPADLRKRIEDLGLTVESAIGFPSWLANDPSRRAAGVERMKQDMDLLARIGGKRVAAPPAGLPRGETVELNAAAERYLKILEIGDSLGVIPQIEMWAGSAALGRVSAAVAVAIETGHPKACFLGDLFHIYRAGCDVDGLRLLGPCAVQVFHMNDYPGGKPREQLRDGDRVMPGDGAGPTAETLRIFIQIGARPALSLELFNRSYWQRDALETARIGLRKLKACAAAAGAGG